MSMKPTIVIAITFASGLASANPAVDPAPLSFEQRVEAQRAIARVYYTHQIGSTLPFAEAVPDALLEQQVSDYLKKSVALESIWARPVTQAALRAEMERIAAHTRFPERLAEIYASLDHDAFLVQETLARQAIVDRLARRLFALDPRFAAGSPERLDWDAWWSEIAPTLDVRAASAVASESASLPSPPASAAAAGSDCAAALEWNNGILGDEPEGRSEHAAVWTGSELIFWGGTNGKDLSAGYRYDPVLSIYTAISETNAPAARYGHTAVWTGSEMIVWGGRNAQGFLQTGGRYDAATDTWTALSIAGAPGGRYDHAAVWTGSRMIVWGGTVNTMEPAFATGGIYDPASDSWTPTAIAGAPSPRQNHTALWTGSRMVVWGGASEYWNDTNTGGRYDPVMNTWTATTLSGAPTARQAHSAVWTGSRMIVWGGNRFGLGNENTGSRYDPVADTWTAISVAPGRAANHTAVWTGTRMIVWGGSPDVRARYDLASNSWTVVAAAPEEVNWHSHTAVWTGSEMLVWGGNYQNSGGRYDPTLNAWTTMTAPANAPDPRNLHSAVWTGNLMLVWGGMADPYTLGDGGRYDPLLDSWSAISAANAPASGLLQTAVWTGQVMIVWGGQGGTGARYDPLADSWTAISNAGAPAPRQRHTAVWTGSSMIVWGGDRDDGGAVLDTGGIYNPASNSWTATSTAGAPSARSAHTAVWTGSTMVVWGGGTVVWGGGVDTGGRYDPAGNQWTPISTIEAPGARRRHTAVWTGSEMIVWGGELNGSLLGDGGRYNPVADEWQPVSTADAPLSRFGHTAIWTGSAMIAWGGRDGNADALDNGGKYDPATDTWQPTVMTRAPLQRYNHSAVWTGDTMIVWAGKTDLSADLLDNGGRYVFAPDGDVDGVRDSCDCAPADGSAFSIPGEVANLLFAADRHTLKWDAQTQESGTGTAYDVLRGSLAELPAGAGPSEACLETASPDPSSQDPSVPGVGMGFYYLVRGANSCGQGSYGTDSEGNERFSPACP